MVLLLHLASQKARQLLTLIFEATSDMTEVGCAAFTMAIEKNVALKTVQLDDNRKISGVGLGYMTNHKLSEESAKAA